MSRYAVLITAFLMQVSAPAGAIRGMVLDALTNAPVPEAVVIVSRASEIPQQAVTASDGSFVLNNLAPGAYTLSAGRSGYITYGERSFQDSAKTVVVKPGVPPESLVVRLTPASAVSGRILNATLQPLRRIPVRLLRSVYKLDGRRGLELSGMTTTNDLGEYRLFGVFPGRYFLAAGGAGPFSDGINFNSVLVETELTFYPAVIDSELAQPLDIAPGMELRGIDLVLPQQRLFRIRGRVSVRDSAELSVHAIFQPEDILGEHWTDAICDPRTGAFEISGLRPGKYLIAATAGGLRGRTTLHVAERDVDGVEIKMSETGELEVRLLLDGEPWHPTPRTGAVLRLENADGLIWGTSQEPDGSLKFSELPVGTYRPFVSNLPQGSYVKAANYGDIDVLENRLEWDVKKQATLNVFVDSKAASVRGIVRTSSLGPAAGAAVVLVPNRRDRRELYSIVETNENGEFRIPNVAPGEYKVFAWEAIEQNAWMDPAVIARFEDKGKAIRLAELEMGNVLVPLIPAENHP